MFRLMVKRKGYELIKSDELAKIKKDRKAHSDFMALYVEQEKQYKIDSMKLANDNKRLTNKLQQVQSQLAKAQGEREAFKSEVDKRNQQLTSVKNDCYNKPYERYKKDYIDYHMTTIDGESNRGCGSYYEIYAERKQYAMADFVDSNRLALSVDEVEYIKKQYEYRPDFEPYIEIDEETGKELTIWGIVRKDQV